MGVEDTYSPGSSTLSSSASVTQTQTTVQSKMQDTHTPGLSRPVSSATLSLSTVQNRCYGCKSLGPFVLFDEVPHDFKDQAEKFAKLGILRDMSQDPKIVVSWTGENACKACVDSLKWLCLHLRMPLDPSEGNNGVNSQNQSPSNSQKQAHSNEDITDSRKVPIEVKLDLHSQSKFITYGEEVAEYVRDESLPKRAVTSTLHWYQKEALIAIEDHFASADWKEAPACIIAPTGSGKSGILTFLPYILRSSKVLVLTPSMIISDQLYEAFGGERMEGRKNSFFDVCGFILQKGEIWSKSLETPFRCKSSQDVRDIAKHNLVIVNAQKFGGKSGASLSILYMNEEQKEAAVNGCPIEKKKRMKSAQLTQDILKTFDTIIVDEAHHFPAKTWENVVSIFHRKKIVFLTATPFRGPLVTTDGEDNVSNPWLDMVKVVYEIKKEEVRGKTVRHCQFKLGISEKIPFSDSEFYVDLKKDIDDIIEHQMREEPRLLMENKLPRVMILVYLMDEAKHVVEGLNNIHPGYATYYVGEKGGEENWERFKKDKEIRAIVVCGKLGEGYDNAEITNCVILRKVVSPSFFQQFVGRCIRMHRDLTGVAKDKTPAFVLSYKYFKQEKLWKNYEEVVQAKDDPVEEPDVYDLGNGSPSSSPDASDDDDASPPKRPKC